MAAARAARKRRLGYALKRRIGFSRQVAVPNIGRVTYLGGDILAADPCLEDRDCRPDQGREAEG